MDDSKRAVINRDYTAENFDGEMLLYNKSGGQAVYLNETAYAVWMLIKEDLTVGQMIVCLEERYPDQKEQIRHDVMTALTTLADYNVIEIQDE